MPKKKTLRPPVLEMEMTTESITTGANPVAANPDTDTTLVVTGGTQDVEVITLDIPSSPATKIGKIKRLVLAVRAAEDDVPQLDPTNLVNAVAHPLSSEDRATYLVPVGCSVEFELVATGAGYAWQARSAVYDGKRSVWTAGVYTGDAASGANPALALHAGNSEDGVGGSVLIRGGKGVADGGAVNIASGQGGAGADGGDIVIGPASGGRASGDLFAGLPNSDPHINNAVYWNNGVLTRSAG
jgi:hypothetical protein